MTAAHDATTTTPDQGPRTPASRWRCWAGEVGWLATSVVSLAWIAGRAHQDVPAPLNGGWREYLSFAGLFLDPGGVASLNPWRHPMWGLLVSMGARVSGMAAWEVAFVFAHISVVAIVLGAALTARTLAGRTAAAFVGPVALGLPLLVEAWLWLDPYPAVGACTATAVALGCVAARWGRPILLGVAGLAAGLAAAMDGRAVGAALSVLGLVALVPLRPGAWRRAVLLLAVLVGVALGPAADLWIGERWCLPHVSLLEQIVDQNAKVHHTQMEQPPLPDLADPGVRSEVTRELLWRAITLPGMRLVARNAANVGFDLTVGVALGLLALVAGRIRGRWRRTDTIALVAFTPPIAVLAAAASLVDLFPRYTSTTWALTLCLAPIAVARGLPGWLPARWRTPWLRRLAVGSTLIVGMACAWPGLRALSTNPPLDPHTVDAAPNFASVVALADGVGTGDTVIDCSNTPVGALVPWQAHYTYDPDRTDNTDWFRCRDGRAITPNVRHYSLRLQACAEFAAAPAGARAQWMLVGAPNGPAEESAHALVHAALRDGGWDQVPLGPTASPEAWRRAPAGPLR